MDTENILDYSTEKIVRPENIGPCDLDDDGGVYRCRKPAYYYEDRVYSVFKEHLCEDHLLAVGVDMESGVYA